MHEKRDEKDEAQALHPGTDVEVPELELNEEASQKGEEDHPVEIDHQNEEQGAQGLEERGTLGALEIVGDGGLSRIVVQEPQKVAHPPGGDHFLEGNGNTKAVKDPGQRISIQYEN